MNNIVTGALLGNGSAFYIASNPLSPPSSNPPFNPFGLLMNVFDGNTASGTQFGFYFASYPVNGTAGIFDTVITNNFFSSDGSAGNLGIFGRPPASGNDGDSSYYDYHLLDSDIWQNFNKIR